MVEILTLCEYASDHGGRLTIIDTFDTMVAAKMPWRAYFYMAAKIGGTHEFANCKTITLQIVPTADDQGKTVFETSSEFVPPKNSGKINLVAGFKGLIFEQAGDYCFRILIDNNAVAECRFKVILKNHD